MSLCVLSLPDVMRREEGTVSIDIPAELTAKTSSRSNYVLFNKRDLLSEREINQVVAAIGKLNVQGAWAISLDTGEGTGGFMREFGDILRAR